jgi:hypothetical protein
MRFILFVVAALLALPGCHLFLERAPDYAVNAMDSTADRTTNVVLDKAEDAARNPSQGEERDDTEEATGEKVTRTLDNDDVLLKQGNDYLVGKLIGKQVLLVRTGQKVDAAGQEVIPVRRAKKGDLKVGQDAWFTTAKGDVRRAAWATGAVTDDASLGDGTVGIGPETGILWESQVAVRR